MSRADRWLGATLVLMALAWLWLVSTEIPDAGTEWPGPRGFPVLLGIVLALLGSWLIAFPERRNPDPASPIPGSASRSDLAVAGAVFALLVLYAFLLDRAGFLIATPFVIVLAMGGVLRMRRWRFIACFAAIFPLGCWVVFNTVLGIPLPRGSWVAW
jgi:hypothetical protein